MNIELRHCPECGAHPDYEHGKKWSSRVVCEKCGFEGPWMSGLKKAAKAWNDICERRYQLNEEVHYD